MRKPKKSTKLWLARDKSGEIRIFDKKPRKFAYYWYIYCTYMQLDRSCFPDVKWEDKEPTLVTLKI